MFGLPDTGDYLVGHEDHRMANVGANMVEYLECDTCEVILAVWNREEDLLWKNGGSLDDLHHYVGHGYVKCDD